MQFAVLQEYENETFYDTRGRIVFTTNRSLTGIGFTRQEFEEIKHKKTGTFTRTIIDNTISDTPVERTIEYEAPFDTCDREKDYETAWDFFSKKIS
jgi:hypothetical protein